MSSATRLIGVLLLAIGILFLPWALFATALSLSEAEMLALKQSPWLKATQSERAAAAHQADAQWATYFPKLSFEANGKYVSEIPKLRIGLTDQPFGDNESYSLGPTLSYVLWDSGIRRHTYKSLRLLQDARSFEVAAVQRQLLFNTRMSYLQAQISAEKFRYVSDVLASVQRQTTDIEKRFRAGSVNRLDYLNSQMDLASYEVRASQARVDWQSALSDLRRVLGEVNEAPVEWQLEKMQDGLGVGETHGLQLDRQHPQLSVVSKTADSLQEAASAKQAAHWPQVQVSARSSVDYPHGPSLQQVQQNTFMVNMSWSLFEFGRVQNEVEKARADALAARWRRDRAEIDMVRDWEKAWASLQAFSEQRNSAARAAERGAELAKLKFSAYSFGKISFSDVQTANLQLLEAQIRLAQIQGQMLSQIYFLRMLSGEEKTP